MIIVMIAQLNKHTPSDIMDYNEGGKSGKVLVSVPEIDIIN